MSDKRTPKEIQRDNFAHFMKRGPALSSAYGTYVVARDPSQGKLLLGGLGAMGCGQMWVNEQESHKDYSGYKEAPVSQEIPVAEGAVVSLISACELVKRVDLKDPFCRDRIEQEAEELLRFIRAL